MRLSKEILADFGRCNNKRKFDSTNFRNSFFAGCENIEQQNLESKFLAVLPR